MKTLLTLKNMCKSFSGVKVLKNVQLSVNEGEVHALMGANGAGKSTLMKILTGVYEKDSGTIYMKNSSGKLEPIEINSPRHALDYGVGMVYQEFNLVGNLSIAENIFLGREPLKKHIKTIDWPKMVEDTRGYLQEVGIDLDPMIKVEELSTAQKQTVEIAKCLSLNSKLIIMDEPTASLTGRETTILFKLIDDLKKKGYSIIYISHRMEEIFAITDRITVMTDGCYIATLDTAHTHKDELVRMMIGKDIGSPQNNDINRRKSKEVMLTVQNLSTRKLLKNINFSLKKGEILGFFGLVGSGRTELARAIFGIDKITQGEIHIEGKKVSIKSPNEAVQHHIGLVPEDRKDYGLILNLSIKKNMVLTNLRYVNPFLWEDKTENELASKFMNQLSIVAAGQDQKAGELSGGNQQKVVIAKWLAISPKILILDEPTRGIDIGAKTEIYHLMRRLANQGMSIIMISSELPEVMDISDRIIVMHEGKISLDCMNENLNQETIMHSAMGDIR